jgi:hypothetical protein
MSFRRSILLFALFGVAPLLWAQAPTHAASATEPLITYRKIFRGSTPEFAEIKLNEQGKGTYDIRQLSDDASRRSR